MNSAQVAVQPPSFRTLLVSSSWWKTDVCVRISPGIPVRTDVGSRGIIPVRNSVVMCVTVEAVVLMDLMTMSSKCRCTRGELSQNADGNQIPSELSSIQRIFRSVGNYIAAGSEGWQWWNSWFAQEENEGNQSILARFQWPAPAYERT